MGDLLERLAQAGQAGRGERGGGGVVEAGDRDVRPGAQAALAQRAERAEGERVGRADDGGGGVRRVEQPVGGGATRRRSRRRSSACRSGSKPRAGERLEPALAPVAAGLGVERPADVGDPAVALAGHVLGGGADAGAAVDVDPGQVLVAVPGPAERGERDVQLAQRRDPGVAGVGAGEHERVDRGGGEQVAVGRDLAGLVVGVAQDQVAAGRTGGLGQRVQELVEQQRRPVVARGLHLDPDQPRPLVAQRARGPVGAVAELVPRRPGSGRGWPGATRSGLFSALETDWAETPTCRATSPRVTCPWGVGPLLRSGPCLALKSRTVTEVTQIDQPETTPRLQPLLHDLASCVAAPGLLLAAADGQVRPGGVERLVRRRRPPPRHPRARRRRARASTWSGRRRSVPTARSSPTSPAASATGFPTRPSGSTGARALASDGLTETVVGRVGRAGAGGRRAARVRGTDLQPMAAVKQRRRRRPATGAGRRGRPALGRRRPRARRRPGARGRRPIRPAHLAASPGPRRAPRDLAPAPAPRPPPSSRRGRPAPWSASVEAADIRVRRTAEQSLADLAGLLLRDGDDRFLAAGSPWFLTLFGRDSLWAARMLVPFDTGLALSTLRVLARRQGTREDPATEEQPGKILHEVRDAGCGGGTLPPAALLRHRRRHPAVRLHPRRRPRLGRRPGPGARPAARRARLPGLADGAVGRSPAGCGTSTRPGAGLSNQGWKDSHDSVQFADGSLAEPPIALCEVQAYAYDAAVRGAALLEAFGAEPVPGLRRVGRRTCAPASRDEFWVGAGADGHVAIALDGDGRPVDSVTSNMGHLLGTGLLDPAATTRVADAAGRPAARLRVRPAHPRVRLATLLAALLPRRHRLAARHRHRRPRARGRRPHSTWPPGWPAGLFVAAEGVDYRLPELYGGDAAADVPLPSAYPAACRPQAWSAAAPLAALVAVTGLVVDASAGVVTHPARTSNAPRCLLAPRPEGRRGAARRARRRRRDGARSTSSPAAGSTRVVQHI